MATNNEDLDGIEKKQGEPESDSEPEAPETVEPEGKAECDEVEQIVLVPITTKKVGRPRTRPIKERKPFVYTEERKAQFEKCRAVRDRNRAIRMKLKEEALAEKNKKIQERKEKEYAREKNKLIVEIESESDSEPTNLVIIKKPKKGKKKTKKVVVESSDSESESEEEPVREKIILKRRNKVARRVKVQSDLEPEEPSGEADHYNDALKYFC